MIGKQEMKTIIRYDRKGTKTKRKFDPMHFNPSFLVKIEFRKTLIQNICDDDSTERCFTAEKVSEVVMPLRKKKAADLPGLSAEHIKYGMDQLIDCLRDISNRIVNTSKIPKIFKQGVITPVYKKQGKPLNDPNSYSRITVSSILGK